MKLNKLSDKVHATVNDSRVTKIGGVLRKTSMDELPQFFNVLKGDMSIVGPRPHLQSLSMEYQKDVDDYLKRHVVKPGITGLAQVSGYRGEIKKKSDIKNRVRLDIFYIENWSFLLDIKIILMTIFNVFKGEEKSLLMIIQPDITASIVIYREEISVLQKAIDSFLGSPFAQKIFLIDNSPNSSMENHFQHPKIQYLPVRKI